MNPNDRNHARGQAPHDQQNEGLAELNQLKHVLRQAMPPLSADRLEPRSDLWPHLHKRLESRSPTDRAAKSIRHDDRVTERVPWFDWALAVLAAAALLIFPGIIPALLYHF